MGKGSKVSHTHACICLFLSALDWVCVAASVPAWTSPECCTSDKTDKLNNPSPLGCLAVKVFSHSNRHETRTSGSVHFYLSVVHCKNHRAGFIIISKHRLPYRSDRKVGLEKTCLSLQFGHSLEPHGAIHEGWRTWLFSLSKFYLEDQVWEALTAPSAPSCFSDYAENKATFLADMGSIFI